MHAEHLVHDLGDAQVDHDRRERERVAPVEAVLAPHQRDHPVDGDLRRSPRCSSKPNVSHAPSIRAIGHSARGRRGGRASPRPRPAPRSPCPETSPSPWAAWPSPAEKRAPSTGIGRYNVVPATSSLQSMLPPQRRGGIVECTPGSSGGIPSTPRNGASRTERPAARPTPSLELPVDPVIRPAERDAPRPGRDLVDPDLQHLPGPGVREPRSARRAHGRCRARGFRDSNGSSRPTSQPAFGVRKRTESPGSTVSTGSSSSEKWPCRTDASSGSS